MIVLLLSSQLSGQLCKGPKFFSEPMRLTLRMNYAECYEISTLLLLARSLSLHRKKNCLTSAKKKTSARDNRKSANFINFLRLPAVVLGERKRLATGWDIVARAGVQSVFHKSHAKIHNFHRPRKVTVFCFIDFPLLRINRVKNLNNHHIYLGLPRGGCRWWWNNVDEMG